MRKLLILLVLLGLLVGADFAARLAAESQLERRLRADVPEAGGAQVSLRSFPFLARLLFAGEVAEVSAEVTDLRTERLRIARVAVDLHDVRVDRDALLSLRQIDLESIGRGTAEAEITQRDLSQALGIPVELTPGKVTVRAGGRTLSLSLKLVDGVLVASGFPSRCPICPSPACRCCPAPRQLKSSTARSGCRAASTSCRRSC